jgi:Transposase DDE domain
MRLRPPPRQPDPIEQLLAQAAYAAIPHEVLAHCRAVPLGVMVRSILEWLLDEQALERLFREHAPEQYTRELTIRSLVDLLIQVSAGSRPSVFAAYKADQASPTPAISATAQAVYTKLGRINPAASEALVRHSAVKLQQLTRLLPAARQEPLPGYHMRVLDGNVLAGCDHRLKPLRARRNSCLPGKSLVVYEPSAGLITDLVLCEDAYTQERVLLKDILPRVQPDDLWLADRNFCTTKFVFGVSARQGHFLIRQHRVNLACRPLAALRKCGQTSTGVVWEQPVCVTNPETGQQLTLRRIEIRLFEKTRDGQRTLALVTNLPETVSAMTIAELYRTRWTIEKQFQFLTDSLHCELPGLGKPRAALFAFAMSLVASNVLAVLRAEIRQAHGGEQEAEISGYYLADEVASDYRTLMKYLPAEQWVNWRHLSAEDLMHLLLVIAQHVNVKALTRHKRGPKKPPSQKPVYDKKHTHYSVARVLNEAKDTC